MILKILCRAHYEATGSFERFRFLDEIKPYAKMRNLDLTDAFYELVGFRHDETVPAKQRVNIRKLAAGRKSGLKKLFGTSDMHQVNELLRRYECVPSPVGKKADYSKISKHIPMIRVLSEYFKNSPDLLMNAKGKEITLGTFLKSLRAITKKSEYVKAKETTSIFARIKSLLPEICVSGDIELPCVYMGKLHVSEPVAEEDLDFVLSALVDHICISSLDVPESTYFKIIKNCWSYQTLDDGSYLELIDLANSMEITFKQLFELCGLRHPNSLEVYEDTGCVMYIRGHDTYQLYSKNSTDPTLFATMKAGEIEYYYKRGTLKTLFWENGAPFVYDGDKTIVGSVV